MGAVVARTVGGGMGMDADLSATWPNMLLAGGVVTGREPKLNGENGTGTVGFFVSVSREGD